MRSEILTYPEEPRSVCRHLPEGSFAALRPDKDANKKLYGKDIDLKELVETGNVAVPEPAKKFIQSVTQATSGS